MWSSIVHSLGMKLGQLQLAGPLVSLLASLRDALGRLFTAHLLPSLTGRFAWLRIGFGVGAAVLMVPVAKVLGRVAYYQMVKGRYKHLPPLDSAKGVPVLDLFGPGLADAFECMRKRDGEGKPTGEFESLRYWGGAPDGAPAVMITDPDAYSTVLADEARFPKYPTTYELVQRLLGNGLVVSHGALWHRQRRVLTPLFHFSALKAAAPIVARNTAQWMADLGKQQEGREQAALTTEDLKRLTLNVIMDVAFGSSGMDRQLMRETWHDIGRQMVPFFIGNRFFGAVWNWLPLPGGLFLKWQLKKVEHRVARALKERQAVLADTKAPRRASAADVSYEGLGSRSVIDELILAGVTDPRQVKDEALTFLLAGHETTASLLAWCLYFLCSHPDIQEEVAAEFRWAVPPGSEGAVSYEAVGRLELLRGVVKEALRLRPPLAFMDRLVGREGEELCGHKLPKGTCVLLGIWATHRDSRYWTNPEAFDPRRWGAGQQESRGEDGSVLPSESCLQHPFAFIPFSAGPRNCIGQKLALLEAMVVLGLVVSEYRVRLAEGCVVNAQLVTTVEPVGLRVLLEKRGA